MKKIVFSVLGLMLLLAACAPAATATPIPPIVLDTPKQTASSSVKASAVVVPAQEAHVSFAISGLVKEVTVSAGDVVDAGQVLATLDTPDLEYAIIQAELAVSAAESTYLFWAKRADHPPERRQVELDRLEQAKRSLETAQAQLTRNTLLAPFTATVISVEALPGEYFNPGHVVLALANLDELKIETTDLSELNIAAVQIGQSATVYIEALGESFPGTVTAISPISSTIGGDVVFKVTITLDEQPPALLWGMSADVEITVK